jgi:hypothetical protein
MWKSFRTFSRQQESKHAGDRRKMLDIRAIHGHPGEAKPPGGSFDADELRSTVHGDEHEVPCAGGWPRSRIRMSPRRVPSSAIVSSFTR